MAATSVEQSRVFFDDLERLEHAIAQDMKKRPKSHVNTVLQQHRIKDRLDHMQQVAKKQKTLFDDADGMRKEEISNMSSGNVFSTFYDALREVREYHRAHAGLQPSDIEDNIDAIVNFSQPEFSGEEAYGRYFDLHEHFHRFRNLAANTDQQLDYLTYLQQLSRFDTIALHHKRPPAYGEYLDHLLAYLVGFQTRAQPINPSSPLDKLEREFDERWEKGEVSGWNVESPGLKANGHHANGAREGGDSKGEAGEGEGEGEGEKQNEEQEQQQDKGIDLEGVSTEAELEELGMERLKEELERRGLKSGGTLEQRAQRLFSVKGLADEDIPLHLRPGKGKAAKRVKKLTQREVQANKKFRKLALTESKIELLLQLMQEVLDATVERTHKNLSRTYAEIEAQHEEEERVSDEEDEGGDDDEEDEDEDDRPHNNPKNLPLGYDGKPIPYWLYKLHGLGIEFKCEICGGASYWGRRAFDRHFQEWRHARAMRWLKIPNTKHFHDITRIEDALTLHEKIKHKLVSKTWRAEQEEEFEDSQGNVLNKKTYFDLQRQGLL